MKSKPRPHMRIKRPDKEDLLPPGSGSGPSSNNSTCAFSDCGDAPKSCADINPKSKVTKVGSGSRGGRVILGPGKLDKEECSVAECNKDGEEGPQSRLDERSGNGHDHGHGLDTEDGWEAAADALGLHSVPERPSNSLQTEAVVDAGRQGLIGSETTLPKAESGTQLTTHAAVLRSTRSRRAWKRDDLCRPNSRPSLHKKQNLPAHSGCINGQQWSPPHKPSRDVPAVPPQCPICTEDLDSTDSSFHPCPCGFSLCLFCYHRIASDDGRCPGCRTMYSRDVCANST